MKTVLTLFAAAGLLAATPVLAHGNTAPQHGGVVQMSGETLFELVRVPAGISIYVTDDEEPLPAAGATARATVTMGGKTRTIDLRAGPGNRFDAPGLKLVPGARLAVQVVNMASQTRFGTTFVVK